MKQLPVRLLRGPLGLLIFWGLQGPILSFAQSTVGPSAQSITGSIVQSTPRPAIEPAPISPAELHRYEAEARQVKIVRDRWGIPHIYGKTDAAAVFGLLYTECQNDFSRVEKNYLEMLGRQAEAYGESYLYNDVMMRLIYDSAQAVKDYQNSPSWMHALLDAFADGINYYLYKHPETKPILLKRWEPWYALMFTDGSVSATSTGGIRPEEIRNFYYKGDAAANRPLHLTPVEKMVLADRGISVQEEKPAEGITRVLQTPADRDPDGQDQGSNGFAIAPSRTASGNTLLYINPHVPYYFRMEVQLVSEEGLNAYGAVTWGQFFIYQGFNAHCGWMHTSSYADVADLYEEKVNRNTQGWEYQYEGQSKSVTSKPFTVYYKKDGQLLSLPVKGYYTHHGPVMGSRNGKWLSLKEYNRSLNALLEAWLITKATTFDAYKAAMDIRANTTNNTVYADDQGNIAYWHGNFMPRRDTAYHWSSPVDGAVAATEWKGLHELEEIVHVYNPSTGWIQNCNSTPFNLSGSSSPDRSKYPSYMAPDGENFRALNAVRLLQAADHLTLDSLIAKGYDHYLTAFDLLLPALFDAYDGSDDSVKRSLQEPVTLLRQWDKRSAVHSIATTLAIEWGTRMAQYVPKPGNSDEAPNAIVNVNAEIASSSATQKLHELAAVVADLQQRFGTWKMEWGELCRYQRLTGKITETYDDQLPSLPIGLVSSAFGSLPSVQSRVMKDTKKRYGYSGNSFIAAVEFGKKVTARTIMTGGESSDPSSPHFSDQASMYLEGRFKDVLFYKEDVLRHKEKEYHPGDE
ncbi:MAG TPA: penicillin acylase family protein [Puia sp.]|nr:penicillin acylase family protein [Puia sp.]